jgi:hypothetical protein
MLMLRLEKIILWFFLYDVLQKNFSSVFEIKIRIENEHIEFISLHLF